MRSAVGIYQCRDCFSTLFGLLNLDLPWGLLLGLSGVIARVAVEQGHMKHKVSRYALWPWGRSGQQAVRSRPTLASGLLQHIIRVITLLVLHTTPCWGY